MHSNVQGPGVHYVVKPDVCVAIRRMSAPSTGGGRRRRVKIPDTSLVGNDEENLQGRDSQESRNLSTYRRP